jgi:methyltransferase-like protein
VKDQPNNQSAPAVNGKNILKNKKQLSLILGVVLVLVLSTGIAFYSGIQVGKKEATKAINRKIGDFLNPLTALATNPLFPDSIVGKVTNVNGKSITVKRIDGKTETISITDKTLITQNTKTLSTSDIKKDANVTVFTAKSANKDSLSAARIIVRS